MRNNHILLYDAQGNPISTIVDGAVRRLQTEAKIASWFGSTAPTVGQKAAGACLPVVLPSDQVIQVSTVPLTSTSGLAYGRVLIGSPDIAYPMMGTTYIEQTVNFTGSIRSTSVLDTAAGTGARTLEIEYFDQTGAGPFTETVTLNGTTAVNLVQTNHCFIQRMRVLTVGSLGWNAGTISLYTGAGGTGVAIGSIAYNVAYKNEGDNKTFWAHRYIAAGKTATFYTISFGTNGNQTGRVFMRLSYPLSPNTAVQQITESLIAALNTSTTSRRMEVARLVAGFSRVYLTVISNGSNTTFYGGFDYTEAAT